MIALTVCSVAAIAVLGGLLFWVLRDQREQRLAWALEREGWIRLVQSPDRAPTLTTPDFPPDPDPADEEDEFALVGTIQPGVGEDLDG